VNNVSTGAEISRVTPGSPAAKVNLKPGDKILQINGVRPVDLIDYLSVEASPCLHLVVADAGGGRREIRLEKPEEKSLGLAFTSAVFDRVKTCCNHCLFCFVDQMPPGLRKTLYLKDDDYRLSFLQGSYITLTNLKKDDWRRIKELRLSPLYISVHATDPKVRRRLFGRSKAGEIMPLLERLASWGIAFHAQVVVCPGINDRKVLAKTLFDLGALWPALQSLAVVPVGLTGYRQELPELRGFEPEEAEKVLELVGSAQKAFSAAAGTRLVYAADEFFLQAQKEIPPLEYYEDLWQLANGVGLWALFKEEFLSALARISPCYRRRPRAFVVLTGRAAAGLWEELSPALKKHCPWITLEVRPVTSSFGPEVTVAGLVTGNDIIQNLRENGVKPGREVILPGVMLRREERDFLDGRSLKQVEKEAGVPLQVIETTGEAAVKALLGWEENKQ